MTAEGASLNRVGHPLYCISRRCFVFDIDMIDWTGASPTPVHRIRDFDATNSLMTLSGEDAVVDGATGKTSCTSQGILERAQFTSTIGDSPAATRNELLLPSEHRGAWLPHESVCCSSRPKLGQTDLRPINQVPAPNEATSTWIKARSSLSSPNNTPLLFRPEFKTAAIYILFLSYLVFRKNVFFEIITATLRRKYSVGLLAGRNRRRSFRLNIF